MSAPPTLVFPKRLIQHKLLTVGVAVSNREAAKYWRAVCSSVCVTEELAGFKMPFSMRARRVANIRRKLQKCELLFVSPEVLGTLITLFDEHSPNFAFRLDQRWLEYRMLPVVGNKVTGRLIKYVRAESAFFLSRRSRA